MDIIETWRGALIRTGGSRTALPRSPRSPMRQHRILRRRTPGGSRTARTQILPEAFCYEARPTTAILVSASGATTNRSPYGVPRRYVVPKYPRRARFAVAGTRDGPAVERVERRHDSYKMR